MTINLFKISKAWFDLSFDNHKLKSTHTAFIFYCIDLNNRLSWSETFGLPAHHTCQVLNFSYKTFIKTLNELIDFGFIRLVEKTYNQHTTTIISLDLLYLKMAKQRQSKGKAKAKQGTIIKPNKLIKPINIHFDIFWNLYDYKKGKDKAVKKWESLKDEDRESIINYLPSYIKSTPDKKYRKHPMTFLNNESWNDEIIKEQSILDEYEKVLSINNDEGYKMLIEIKKDILYSFDSIITLEEYNKLNLNGKSSKSFFISFQSYGKNKREFLNNLYTYVRKYQ